MRSTNKDVRYCYNCESYYDVKHDCDLIEDARCQDCGAIEGTCNCDKIY